MNESFFHVILSLAVSIFFGIVSNWIYDLLRDREFLPDKPTLKNVTIVFLAGLFFIVISNLQNTLFGNLLGFLKKHASIPNWVIISLVVLAILIGYFWRQRRIKKLTSIMRKKDKRIEELEKSFEQQARNTQDTLEEHIINPQ